MLPHCAQVCAGVHVPTVPTSVNALVLASILKLKTPFESPTKTKLPVGSIVTAPGLIPAVIRPIEVRPPVVALRVYIETSFEAEFVTYRNLPVGWTAAPTGEDPAATCPILERVPVVMLMAYIETSFE